ncbi:MAG: hypothetical protein ACJAT7_003299 [Psychromonas sp.]|jgi:hypothetical protein|uniref:SGNH/GDSL hydrolase family protein n=1 Tax=Psychromonas sp. TaxID=1884585 RepID=UPI0039E69529
MHESLVNRIKYRLSRKKKILVLGDSHTAVFKNAIFNQHYIKYLVKVVDVGGATVSGLTNPNSTTQALPIFRYIYKVFKPHHVIFQLGEVDTGFVIWYRAEKHQKSIDEMLQQCIKNYADLLDEFKTTGKTIVISAPLPTIQDDQDWGDIANARKEISASQRERIILTQQFNQAIKLVCEEKNIFFIDLDNDSLGDDGFVKSELLNQNENDHHYDHKNYILLIMSHLKRIL